MISNLNTIRSGLVVLIVAVLLPCHLFAGEGLKPIEPEAGFYYTVQKGDTLWGLSERFYNSPWMWPDLWRNNPHIKNAHVLEPGTRVRLFYKKPTDGRGRPDKDALRTDKLPPKNLFYFLYPGINAVGFLKDEPMEGWGVIFRTKDEQEWISQDDHVYINPNKHKQFSPGDRFTIYRVLDRMNDPKTGVFVGVQHYIVGVAEILEHETHFALARVVTSYREIRLNDRVIPFIQRSPKIVLTESKQGIDGRIINSEEQSEWMGAYNIAFVNKGKADGLAPGQTYSLFYRDQTAPHPKTKKRRLLARFDFGKILVLLTEQTTSTVLVTKSMVEVTAGARFGTPKPIQVK